MPKPEDELSGQPDEGVGNDQPEPGATEPDSSKAESDSKSVSSGVQEKLGLDGEYSVDQVKELIDKGEKFGELQSEFTRRSQRLRELEDKMENTANTVEKSARENQMTKQEKEDEMLLNYLTEEVEKRRQEKTGDDQAELVRETEKLKLRDRFGDELTPEMEEEVMDYAAENEVPSLVDAYKLMKFDDLKKKVDKRQKKIEKEKESAKGTAGEGTGSKKQNWFDPYDPKEDKDKSLEDVISEAEQELTKAEEEGR